MSTCPTVVIKSKLSSLMTYLEDIRNEAGDIYNAYWKSDAQPLVNALSTDATAATVTTKLTKLEYTNGITTCEQIDNFFTNSAVTQADYLQHIFNIKYGNDAAAQALSNATEAIADRMYNLCNNLLEVHDLTEDILKLWTVNELDSINTAIASSTIFPGFCATKDMVNAIITLVQQFNNLLDNSAVTTGDYSASLMKWKKAE